jgi:hypothetical protein
MARPKGFAFYGSGQWTIPEGYAANKFMKAGLGNNHIDGNARLCMASAVTGFLSTYGVDEPAGCYDDLDACDVLIMWGNNPAEMHPVLFSRVIDRRSRGERSLLIDIGTRRTRTTEHASTTWSSSRTRPGHRQRHRPPADRQRHVRQGVRRAHCNFRSRQRAGHAARQADDLRGVRRGRANTRPSTSRDLRRAGGQDPHAGELFGAATCASPACGAWA